MQAKLNNGIIFKIVIVLVIATMQACGIKEIVQTDSAPKEYRANRGDSVTVDWKFDNADRVYVDGSTWMYDAEDSIKIVADKSKEVVIRAFQGNVDSVVERKTLYVYDMIRDDAKREFDTDSIETELSDSEIQRGPIRENPNYEEAEAEPSEYFRGLAKKYASPKTLRVTRATYDKSNPKQEKMFIRALLLDKFGNFTDCRDGEMPPAFELEYGCEDKKIYHAKSYNSILKRAGDGSKGCDFSLLVDNSVAAVNNDEVLSSIRSFSGNLILEDRIELAEFGTSRQKVFDMTEPENAISELIGFNGFDEPNGLNSLYKAAYQTIKNMQLKDGNDRALVLITHYNDNSSIVYTANDLIKLANEKNIPIYVVALGDAMRTYYLNYICMQTGGKFYHLFDEEIGQLDDVLNEISFQMKNYYLIAFDVPNMPSEIIKDNTDKCTVFKTELKYKNHDAELNDEFEIYIRPVSEYFQYQAVALFDVASAEIENEYKDLLDSLSITLKDNPIFKIVLTGNSSNEGNSDFNTSISLERAQAVKKYLTESGVPETQIGVKAFGNRKPLYFGSFLPEWQERLNRRVELRWIDPGHFPVEIVVERANSETEAEAVAKRWRKRGFKVYYERIIEYGIAQYQLKLWGYETELDALKEIERIQEKYKLPNCFIE